MKKRKIYLIFLFIVTAFSLFAQQLPYLRKKTISLYTKPIQIDSLSIVPFSLYIKDTNGTLLSDSIFNIDYVKFTIALKPNIISDSNKYEISYRVFPINFSQTYRHKNTNLLHSDISNISNPFTYQTSENSNSDIFSLNGLNKSGNIARGMSFGNNQDVVINSTLNLQLSGQLSDGVEILAAITDNNIPIQPDGNTQQIQDFDKVFIQLSNQQNKVIAGDYELYHQNNYFLKYFKKAQGISLENRTNLNFKENNKEQLISKFSIAVSKGKYARNLIQGIEGSQGPYLLKGAENERYIIVLAGSEKVYLDGQLLTRGQNNDYTIDYNVAEITFTPNHLITKDNRIIVEFEYSDKNYTRSLIQAGTTYTKNNKLKFNFDYLSEQDAKNQPIIQTLNNPQKLLLSKIGDRLDKAIYPNIDSLGFNPDEIRYKITDTIYNGIIYDSVFIYSTNPQDALYRLGFSSVGVGKGNYRQIKSTANGRIYEWVAPINGIPQGDHEAIVLLITPKKKNMFITGMDYKFSEAFQTNIELAISQQDQNLFSTIDDKDNNGLGLKYGLNFKHPIKKDSLNPLYFESSLLSEIVNKQFKPLERYRTSEFERNWNIPTKDTAVFENINSLILSINDGKQKNLTYTLSNYIRANSYQGYQNNLTLKYHFHKFQILSNADYTHTLETKYQSGFLKHQIRLTQQIKNFQIGIREESEQNKYHHRNNDSLFFPSQYFNIAELFFHTLDSNKTQFNASYKKRWDYIPNNQYFKLNTFANDISFGIQKQRNPNNFISLKTIYRKLYIIDTSMSLIKPDESILLRFEYNKRLLKGGIVSNTYYEIGSGMEQKKEYTYVEVAPGQGTYTWKDYNQNNIKELNEFEIALYQDEASFIRIFTPTNDYIKAYNQIFNQIINITPQLFLKRNTKTGKIIARFSSQTAYRIDRKTTNHAIVNVANPFISSINDTALTSLRSSLRNTLFFNRNSARFSIDFTYQQNQIKNLLINGFESRYNRDKELKIRYYPSKSIMLLLELDERNKYNDIAFFKDRNFDIKQYQIKPQLEYQIGTGFRWNLNYSRSDKSNLLGNNEIAHINDIGSEIRYNKLNNGSLQIRFNYIHINYLGENNSAIAYEMLDGLQSGKNFTWEISYQKSLAKNMQMNIAYEGRKPEAVKTIHLANIQFRAFF